MIRRPNSPRRSRFVVVAMAAAVALVGAVSIQAPADAAVPSSSAAPSAPTSSLTDAQSAPTEAQASAIAAQYDHAVVAESDTTPTEQVSALPNGTMQLTENTVPVRVKKSSGWVPVDTTLTTGADGLLAPSASDNPVEFSNGGSTFLAKVQTGAGNWTDVSSPFGVLPTPTVSGSTATYSNVLPGVNLVLTATADGMSEVLVVESATAAANPALAAVKFGVSGSTLAANQDGLDTATAPNGSSVLSTTPTWWDSSDGSGVGGTEGDAFADPVAQSNTSSSISLNAQAAIASRAVQYPVYIDPDWTGGLEAFTDVDAAYPTTSYWDGAHTTNGDLGTGYVSAAYSSDDRNHTARSLWQMNTSSVEGKEIISAAFDVTEDHSFNCTASEVDLYWSGGISSGTTWNSQPGLIQEQSSATVAYGESACPEHAVGFTATAAVQGAANENAAALTLELHAANEATNTSWKRFLQSASLIIDYDSVPNVPSSATIATPVRTCGASSTTAPYLNSTGGVTVQANFTDPDTGNVTPTFNLYNSSGTLLTSYTGASAAQGTMAWTISSSLLPTGNVYYWTATGYDGLYRSAASTACYFSTLNSDPDLPTITGIPGANAVNVGQAFSVVFNSVPADHVVSFAYWWGDGAPSSTAVPPVLSPGFSTTSAPITFPSNGSATSVPASSATPAFDGSVRVADPGSSGSTASLMVAPIDDTSTLYVTAYDAAGNESKSGTVYSTGAEVTANPSPAVNYASGHEWYLEALAGDTSLPNPVPDLNTSAGTGLTSAANVSLGTSVNTSTIDDPDGFDSVPVFDFTPTSSPTSANVAETTAATVDTTQSFTVTAWADPTSVPASGLATLVSQSGTSNSGFALGLSSSGQWIFCLQPQVSGAAPACATSQSSAVLSQWTEVTGIWDSVNQQVRLLIGNSMVGPATAHPPVAGDTSAAGALEIGSAETSGAVAYQWNGEIDDPAIFPGVIDVGQLTTLNGFYQL